jgi:hypothetical protein
VRSRRARGRRTTRRRLGVGFVGRRVRRRGRLAFHRRGGRRAGRRGRGEGGRQRYTGNPGEWRIGPRRRGRRGGGAWPFPRALGPGGRHRGAGVPGRSRARRGFAGKRKEGTIGRAFGGGNVRRSVKAGGNGSRGRAEVESLVPAPVEDRPEQRGSRDRRQGGGEQQPGSLARGLHRRSAPASAGDVRAFPRRPLYPTRIRSRASHGERPPFLVFPRAFPQVYESRVRNRQK